MATLAPKSLVPRIEALIELHSVMPEVPGNIQENLAHLELEANPVGRLSGLQSPAPVAEMQGSEPPTFPSRNSSISTLGTEYGLGPASIRSQRGYQQNDKIQQNGGDLDRPTFSPFPELKNRPNNVPPSDEEREAILERARNPVLNSNDPEMQLVWAQDALAYVEVATQDQIRTTDNASSRPQTPQVEHQLRVDAVNVVSFLADQQHPRADFIRGMWLEFGKFNFRVDRREAYHCYSRAAQKGYARAEYRIGMQYENSNDPEKAIRHYELGVQAKDSASSYRVGMMHLLGQHGKPLDYARGVQLIKFAADSADENAPQGAYVYGMLQARELPQVDVPEQYLPFDLGASRYHIEKAAYLGFAKAQTKMGSAYELCQLGCDFNPALSLHYNALAARQGESEAEMAISKWFLCGVEGVLEKNEGLAFTYARRAALAGLPTAEFAMGYFFEIGINTSVDLDEAKAWYRKAADHGNKDAAARIEGISRSKTLSKKDHHGAAIAKIQSQYGSHKGKRPDRFKYTSSPMPTIADTGAEMPNPNSYALRTGTPQQRPASVAPYPEDDIAPQPSRRPYNVSANSSPDLRTGANGVGGVPLDPNYRGPSAASMRLPQQYSNPDNLGPGRGRGTPVNNMSGSSGSQGYRQPSLGASKPQTFGSHVPEISRPQSAGVAGIGYLGPLESGGPDGSKRLQKQGPLRPNANTSGLRPLPNSTNGPADRTSGQRLSSLPHSQTFAADSRPQTPYTNTGKLGSAVVPYANTASRPGSTMQSPMQNSTTLPARTNGYPVGPSLPSKTPVERPAATPPVSATPKPPGKGPKTFEEMGVPQGKRDQDCVCFFRLVRVPLLIQT